MRTTVNLDEALVKELMAVTGAKTKTQAIHQAPSQFVRRQKRQRRKALSGKIHLDLDWRQLEEEEMKAQAERARSGVVIVDTSGWTSSFNHSGEKRAIGALIDAGRAAMVGVVLAELLQGLPHCRGVQHDSLRSHRPPVPGGEFRHLAAHRGAFGLPEVQWHYLTPPGYPHRRSRLGAPMSGVNPRPSLQTDPRPVALPAPAATDRVSLTAKDCGPSSSREQDH